MTVKKMGPAIIFAGPFLDGFVSAPGTRAEKGRPFRAAPGRTTLRASATKRG
jgi:hypothetical protein